MARLIAVTGFSGAGKTTAINYVAAATSSNRIYVGQLVLDEIRKRGLPLGAESERIVRLDLRQRHGLAGLAVLATSEIQQSLKLGKSVLVDAVLSVDELDHYRQYCDSTTYLASILTSFDVRADRLASRTERKLSRDELLKRDDLELVSLRTDRAIAAADTSISNEGTLRVFEQRLRRVLCKLIAGPLEPPMRA
jgi:dephospho-CoA kinase